MSAGTFYKIIYSVGNSESRKVLIHASSPFIALREFKRLMPKIVYENSLIDEIIYCDEPIAENDISAIIKRCFLFTLNI